MPAQSEEISSESLRDTEESILLRLVEALEGASENVTEDFLVDRRTMIATTIRPITGWIRKKSKNQDDFSDCLRSSVCHQG